MIIYITFKVFKATVEGSACISNSYNSTNHIERVNIHSCFTVFILVGKY